MDPNFFRRLADWQARHRRWVLLGLALATLAAALQLPRLRFDFRPEALLEFSAEERAYAAEIEQRFSVPDNLLLIVLEGATPGAAVDAGGLTLLFQLTEAAVESGLCEQVVSLTNVPRRDPAGGLAALALGRLPPLIAALPVTPGDVERVGAQLGSSRMLPGQVVSADGSTAVVVMALKAAYRDHALLDQPFAELQMQVEGLLDGAGTVGAGEGYGIHYGGLPYVRLETVRHLKREQRLLWPLTAALYAILLWALYRHLALALAPLVAVGLASLWGIALLPVTDSEINIVNNIVPSLILVVGVCNAIHMLHAYVAARRGGADGPAAARQMMAELGLPVFLASVTTAIGFASLMVARNDTLRDLGWQASSGILLSYLALITVLPFVVSRLRAPAEGDGTLLATARAAGRDRLAALVGGVQRHPRRALALTAGVLVLVLANGARVPVDAQVIDTFPPGHPIYDSNQLVEAKLGGILPLELHLRGSRPEAFIEAAALHEVFAIQRQVATLPGVLDVRSVVDLVAEVHGVRDDEQIEQVLTPNGITFALATLRRFQPQALALFLAEEAAETRIAVRLADRGIRASLATLEQIEAQQNAWVERFETSVELRLTGHAYLASRGLDVFIRDLILSLATAGGVIFLVLVAVFRSLRMGLLGVLPTMLPLAATLGLMPLYGYQLNTSTVVVFTLSIGMAVDNTIHLLTAFRRARLAGQGLDSAIRHTFRHAGAAVVASNLLLIGGFAILFASQFEPIFRVAALTTTTIAMALAAAILVLPALLALWGGPVGPGSGVERRSAVE